MPALDTHVLVHHLVQDEPAQSAAASELIRRAVAAGQALFVPVTATLELEWVLRSNFGFTREEVMATLSSLFAAAELSFESERALEVALHLYREGAADFADGLHIALASQAGELPLWTFDKRAAKLVGAKALAR